METGGRTRPGIGKKSLSVSVTRCPTCDRLTAEFEHLEWLYGRAILVLASLRETADADEYMKLRKLTNEARLDSETARRELEKHRRIHASAN